ncbi:YaaW family protein [Candidatus Uabimicrobium amorphum]|uniref:UPF0174 protein n=1 Tax=Uabimicrobium amorphum TaxID=2596890 RepID=A0A5S9IMM4_UABAM|nr:YaaW family protein [Candidatus Uabimicrobium amorphum]BBM83355.1 UPF0174 protein [Candidatus Uabimicrobium amorphum]
MSVSENIHNRDLVYLYKKSNKQKLREIYKRHKIQDSQPIEKLVEQILYDGSNGIGYWIWGAANYLDLVQKVASQMKIKKDVIKTNSVLKIEQAILDKMSHEILQKASPEERRDIQNILLKASKKYKSRSSIILTSGSVVTTLISTVGRQVATQIIQQIMTRIAARFAARELAKRGATIVTTAIPIINVIMWSWTVIDLAGPAYRKIVPTVIETSLIRLEFGD